ncbi:MAG: hypothetical protein RL215_3480 [Planctomycetota bacterium]|jgi:nucleoside-diphosphate-sugar epimerase
MDSVPVELRFHNSAAWGRADCLNMQIDSPPTSPNSAPHFLTAPASVLIAGCGYTGLRAARFWRNCGAAVAAVTRSAERANLLAKEGLQPLVLDLGCQAGWPDLPRTELVVWCVGYDRSGGYSREAVWLDGLQRFLKQLPETENPRRILLTSSTSVYGDCGGGDVDEQTPPRPEQEGGRACLAAEGVLEDFAGSTGTACVVLRLAGIYGPGRLLRRLEDLRAQVPIAADPDSWLNLVHVDDIVRSLDFCARHPNPPPVMNVAAEATATRRGYYQTLAELAGTPGPVFGMSDSSRGVARGGNRRITSICRKPLGLTFAYENCRAGLQQALTTEAAAE